MPQAEKFEMFRAKMDAAGLSEAAIAAFKRNYDQLVAGVTGLVSAHACAHTIIAAPAARPGREPLRSAPLPLLAVRGHHDAAQYEGLASSSIDGCLASGLRPRSRECRETCPDRGL